VVKAFDQAGLATAFAAMNDPARLAAMTEDRATQTLPNGAVNAAAAMLRHLRPPRKGQAR
jgi:hypothetical protein